jgi:hypothetical protein
MKIIKEKRLELENIINSLAYSYTTENENGFTFNIKQGVRWGKTSRKKKWGQAFEETKRFYCAIDFMVGSYELNELSERVGLPIRCENEEVSGIRKISCPEYDTVQISLYNDHYINKYSFRNDSFMLWIKETASRNAR